jgi:hypothetical protein
VFTAAEKAAQHIITMAREEGDDIRRQARVEAETWFSRDGSRQSGSWQGCSRRRAPRGAAQGGRTGLRSGNRGRRARAQERLREETRLIEERISWAHEGLREVTERLEELYPDQSGGAQPPDAAA